MVKLGTKTMRASSKCGRKLDIQRATDSRQYNTDHRMTTCLFVSARAENQMIAPGNILSTRYFTPFQSTQDISMIIEHAHGKKDETMILCSTRSNDAFKFSHMIRGPDLTAQ